MSRSATRRPVVLGVLALLVLGGVGLLFLLSRPDGGTSPSGDGAGVSQPTADRDADAPVVDEVLDEPSAVPTEPADEDPEAVPITAPAPDALRPVVVMSTYSGWDPGAGEAVAGGFVGDAVESGGTCTLTLSRGGVVASGSAEAVPDAATTSCGEVRAGGPALVPGTYEAVLSYTSARSTGESAVFSVVVP
ncbi:hypothetical protein ABC795_14455 [Blastococcus sp. HT6-30]|uniref:hypothetical protein n=1 Tax=Blastococcus sp. HT6-30 TaxID=3144843 RepID=UPI0032192576